MKNEHRMLLIYTLFTLALSFTVLFGCSDDETITVQDIKEDLATCTDCPITVSANIFPNQDLTMAEVTQNINIIFNVPMSGIDLNLIRLQVLGFKGGEVPIGANAFPDVPIATSLSLLNTRILTIDIDPNQDPNTTPLNPGMVFAVTGFEALYGTNGKPFDSLNPNNFLPLIGTKRVLRFTTNAGAQLLALSAAPVQVPNTAQNTAPSGVPSATLDITFSAQAPSGARAFLVFASPGGSGLDPAHFCKVFTSGFADQPPTTLSIPLSQIGSALKQCNQPLNNTQWDDGLTIDVAVAVVNADGQQGPFSPVLTAHDNVRPKIQSVSDQTLPTWRAGAPAGVFFRIRVFFTEEMDASALTNLSNYTISSIHGGSYVVTSATVSATGDPLFVDLSFILTSGVVSNGDSITLGQAIVDEAGNPLDSSADTLMVQGSSIIID